MIKILCPGSLVISKSQLWTFLGNFWKGYTSNSVNFDLLIIMEQNFAVKLWWLFQVINISWFKMNKRNSPLLCDTMICPNLVEEMSWPLSTSVCLPTMILGRNLNWKCLTSHSCSIILLIECTVKLNCIIISCIEYESDSLLLLWVANLTEIWTIHITTTFLYSRTKLTIFSSSISPITLK